MAAAMKISALIATRNRPALLSACIASLLRNTRPPDEIVVMDQSDDLATQTLLRGMRAGGAAIRHEKTTPVGKAAALNRAAALAAGDVFAFTDDDVSVDEKWLETFERIASRHPGVDAFCGRVLPEKNTAPESYLNLVLGEREKWIDRATNPFNTGFCGANIFVKRTALLGVGGFNPLFGPGAKFKGNEDGELAYRLVRGGAKILYCPELAVFHSGWRGERDNRLLKFDYAFSLGALTGYYSRRGDWRLLCRLAVKSAQKLRRLTVGLLLGQKERIIDGYLHLKGFALGIMSGALTPRTGRMPRL
jgi:GT2 family glycosyltransferase